MASALSHRQYPDKEDIIKHHTVQLISIRRPNTIRDSALAFPDFLESTSTWNQNHVIAFRMLDFNDLSINQLYPHSYYPSHDDPVIVEAIKLFKLSKDDFRRGDVNRFLVGPAFSFYRTLQDCLRSSQATPSPPQIPSRPSRQQPQIQILYHQHSLSESSDSSYVPSRTSMEGRTNKFPSEDKSKSVTNMLLMNYLYLLADLENEGKPTSARPRVLFRLSTEFLLI